MFGWFLPCLTLICAADMVPPLQSDLTLSDWRQMLWSSEHCWDEKAQLTFEVCCRYGDDVESLRSILAGERKVLGNPRCWGGGFIHDECCVLNGNWMRIPAYNHMIWQIRMPSQAILNVVQGQVLQTWEERNLMPPGISPKKGFALDGEGLLWGAGRASLLFASMELLPGRQKKNASILGDRCISGCSLFGCFGERLSCLEFRPESHECLATLGRGRGVLWGHSSWTETFPHFVAGCPWWDDLAQHDLRRDLPVQWRLRQSAQ